MILLKTVVTQFIKLKFRSFFFLAEFRIVLLRLHEKDFIKSLSDFFANQNEKLIPFEVIKLKPLSEIYTVNNINL